MRWWKLNLVTNFGKYSQTPINLNCHPYLSIRQPVIKVPMMAFLLFLHWTSIQWPAPFKQLLSISLHEGGRILYKTAMLSVCIPIQYGVIVIVTVLPQDSS